MLQSFLAALFLYHIIKAIKRSSAARKAQKPREEPAAPLHSSAAVNASPPKVPMATEEMAWSNLIAALGNKPWMLAALRRASKPMGLRNMVLGAMFGLASLFLLGMCVMIVITGHIDETDDLWGTAIIAAIGLGTGWMASMFWIDGLRLLKPDPSTTPITGATRYETVKPHPPGKDRKKSEKQFEQL